MSRRDLFLGAFKKSEASLAEVSEASKINIGRVANFPLGEKIQIPQFQMVIESLPEGLRAQSSQNENQYFSIQMNPYGELIVNRSENWPAGVLFSVLTNEAIEIIPSSKEEEL